MSPAALLTRPAAYLVVRYLVLAMALTTIIAAGYLSGSSDLALPVGGLYLACVLGVSAHSVPGVPRTLGFAGLLGASIASGVLVVLAPGTAVIAINGEIAFSAGLAFAGWPSAGVVAAGLVCSIITELVDGRGFADIFAFGAAFIGLWLSGASRRQYVQRAEQAELLLGETRRASEATARAAALAERARIAREIHDIQAHSLSALTLQLEAAGALLQTPTLPKEDPTLVKIAGCVHRAGRLARDGLTETSRAVRALREDTDSLPDLVASLVDTHARADEQAVSVEIHGRQRELPAGTGITLYRTIQEALTNARKHAPNSPVTVELDFEDAEVSATVTNEAPEGQQDRPLTGTGAGYGLTGIKERAELAGGTLIAGPVHGGWQVSVRIPA